MLIRDTVSETTNMTSGVLQSSILSSILLKIYINDLAGCVQTTHPKLWLTLCRLNFMENIELSDIWLHLIFATLEE